MKERSISYIAPMVRAVLDDSKTQTRRVVKRLALEWLPPLGGFNAEFVALPENGLSPYGFSGDRLRVKEAAWMWCERVPDGKTATGRDKWRYVPMREAPVHYAADNPKMPMLDVVSPSTGNKWGWRLKIGRFLPAWASRITLEITGVRVERLHDISEEDAIAEGIEPIAVLSAFPAWRDYEADYSKEFFKRSAWESYRTLWNSINGAGSWNGNPWVWVIEFKRLPS